MTVDTFHTYNVCFDKCPHLHCLLWIDLSCVKRLNVTLNSLCPTIFYINKMYSLYLPTLTHSSLLLQAHLAYCLDFASNFYLTYVLIWETHSVFLFLFDLTFLFKKNLILLFTLLWHLMLKKSSVGSPTWTHRTEQIIPLNGFLLWEDR